MTVGTITSIILHFSQSSAFLRQNRSQEVEMAGGHGHGFTYKGVTLHQPKRWHTVTGKGLCAVMWYFNAYTYTFTKLLTARL